MAKLPKSMRKKKKELKQLRKQTTKRPAAANTNRAMRRKMSQQGIENMDMLEVNRVTMELDDKVLVFDQPQVVAVAQGGVTAYQVIGEPEELSPDEVENLPAAGVMDVDIEDVEEGEIEPMSVEIKPEDIELVAAQAGCSKDEAKAELERTNGDLAKAILNIMN